MTIATYSDLQTALQNWTDRSDLSSNVADFITLAESTINKRLRVRQQLTTVTSVPDANGKITIPSDYLAWKRVTWKGSTPHRELEYVEPTYLSSVFADVPSNTPIFFTIEGASFVTMPIDSVSNIEILYYQKIPALSNSNTTNWLLTANPDLYLAASLVELLAFTEQPELLQAWLAKREGAFNDIIALDQRSRTQLSIRVAGSTP